MAAVTKSVVYRQVVACIHEYLGPATERFVAREVKAHLNKKPQDLTREDIPKLHEWSRLAIAMLADDPKDVETFSTRFLAISKPKKKHHK